MRIALGVEYDGTDFLGWQIQRQEPTVQSTLERALSKVAAAPVSVVCAGRTDTGVHAQCQVVHFDTLAQRSEHAWLAGTNSILPKSIALLWARPVSDDFHARFAAQARRYRYQILNRNVRPALAARYVTWERQELDVARMQQAAQCLIGQHDFSAFRTSACQAKSPIRVVQDIVVGRIAEQIHVEIQANAFLHHMVRNIVGSLIRIGRGEHDPAWMAQLLDGRDRNLAAPTAPAAGLTFLHPLYNVQCGLPAKVCL